MGREQQQLKHIALSICTAALILFTITVIRNPNQPQDIDMVINGRHKYGAVSHLINLLVNGTEH